MLVDHVVEVDGLAHQLVQCSACSEHQGLKRPLNNALAKQATLYRLGKVALNSSLPASKGQQHTPRLAMRDKAGRTVLAKCSALQWCCCRALNGIVYFLDVLVFAPGTLTLELLSLDLRTMCLVCRCRQLSDSCIA